ncbi:Polymer-forming cytoskeletal [Leminorella grimontii]|nr:Polymer-forming cytoskeletal [Leminorella grimontii]
MSVEDRKNSPHSGPLFFAVFILWIGSLILYIRGYLLSSVISSSFSLLFFIYLTNLRVTFLSMFRKKNPPLSTVAASSLSTVADSGAKAADVVDPRQRSTVIARNASFNGDIEDGGDIQIYGSVIGNVNLTNGAIRIMSTGSVKGELRAPEIVIDGNVHGSCLAESIEILEHGTLRGIACCRNLAIRRGGTFIGQSEEWQEPEVVLSVGETLSDESDESAYFVERPDGFEEQGVFDLEAEKTA